MSKSRSKASKKQQQEPFYSVSPVWRDVTPIPLIDGPPRTPGEPDPGPALATIAYSPRYSEAMSYLRAVMAQNEFSQRAINLTEDIIGQNPAHYTVWLYRLKCLKSVWGDQPNDVQAGVHEELEWLEDVSERNLKNYQIWHHRQLLIQLLPSLPPSETAFITHMLSYDSKNYHVWSYRQWLCRRFPDPLLSTSVELDDINTLINQDIRNNSAWNHRYFICFGAEELTHLEQHGGTRKDLLSHTASTSGKIVVDEDIIEREIHYSKAKIQLAPQNPSPWNYLRGVLQRAGIPMIDMRSFCEEFVGGPDADLEGDQVRSSHAIDWLAGIYGEDDGERGKERAKLCYKALAEKWDPIRRKYWMYRAKSLEGEEPQKK